MQRAPAAPDQPLMQCSEGRTDRVDGGREGRRAEQEDTKACCNDAMQCNAPWTERLKWSPIMPLELHPRATGMALTVLYYVPDRLGPAHIQDYCTRARVNIYEARYTTSSRFEISYSPRDGVEPSLHHTVHSMVHTSSRQHASCCRPPAVPASC